MPSNSIVTMITTTIIKIEKFYTDIVIYLKLTIEIAAVRDYIQKQ